jgi:AraC family transcriptional regulator of adaptative response / DNA-3-methyladenine glycosylase II
MLKLAYRPPLQWDALVGFLAARAIPGVEAAGADFYRRTVCIDGRHGLVEVRPVHGQNHLLARVRLADARALVTVVARLRRIFDLGADPEPIATHLGADPRLARAASKLPGLRVPGAWDGFELAVRAILGQQVSVRAATTLAGRIAARYGAPLALEDAAGAPTTTGPRPRRATRTRTRDGAPQHPSASSADLCFVFPTPDVLARADLTTVGLTRARAAAVASLAAAVTRGEVSLDSSTSLEESIAALCALPGIGEWTAHYIAMRALREPDAFPAADLWLRRALSNGTQLIGSMALARAAEAWRPWRAYAAMLLWTMGGSNGTAGG